MPILFLLLTVALGARSRRGVLRWWGAVLAIGGVTVTALAIATPRLFEEQWAGSIAPSFGPSLSPALLGIRHDIGSAVLLAFAMALAIIAGIVALVGVSSLIVAARLGRSA